MVKLTRYNILRYLAEHNWRVRNVDLVKALGNSTGATSMVCLRLSYSGFLKKEIQRKQMPNAQKGLVQRNVFWSVPEKRRDIVEEFLKKESLKRRNKND